MEALARLRASADDATSRVADARDKHRELAIDWFWALISLAIALAMFATGGLGPAERDQRDLDALGVVVAAGMSLPLVWRRRAPIAVFVATMAGLVALGALRYPPDVTIGPAVALFTLAQASGRSVSARAAAGLVIAAYLAFWVAHSLAHDEVLWVESSFLAIVWLALWFAGRGSRLKSEYIGSLEDRAKRAEREAESERKLGAAEERTRIARDLHDSAGHAINVILVEAGAARLLRERDPDRVEQALKTIEEVAREQIGEIDRLVHALRADDQDELALSDCVSPGGGPTGPAAGEVLFERMRASGLDLEVEWEGEKPWLGPRVGRAAFRILQEALTNALRHGTGSARVRITAHADDVELTIENPTRAAPGPERFGLAGMRERVGLLGGTLDFGAANGSFMVRATLPYDPSFDPAAGGHETAAEPTVELGPR